MRILPPIREQGWVPFLWLVYLGFFFIHPVFDHVRWIEWVLTVAGVAVFLVLYFGFFWLKAPRNMWPIAGILFLGISFAPSNAGAAGFFIYAAAFVPFAIETEVSAVIFLAFIAGIALLETWLLHLAWGFWHYRSIVYPSSGRREYLLRPGKPRQLQITSSRKTKSSIWRK